MWFRSKESSPVRKQGSGCFLQPFPSDSDHLISTPASIAPDPNSIQASVPVLCQHTFTRKDNWNAVRRRIHFAAATNERSEGNLYASYNFSHISPNHDGAGLFILRTRHTFKILHQFVLALAWQGETLKGVKDFPRHSQPRPYSKPRTTTIQGIEDVQITSARCRQTVAPNPSMRLALATSRWASFKI